MDIRGNVRRDVGPRYHVEMREPKFRLFITCLARDTSHRLEMRDWAFDASHDSVRMRLALQVVIRAAILLAGATHFQLVGAVHVGRQ